MNKLGPYEVNTIVQGDCLEIMSNLPDGCVDLVVTSPPYWNRKDYGLEPNQLGNINDYNEFVQALNLRWQTLIPILKPGAIVAVNIPNLFGRVAEFGQRLLLPFVHDVTDFFIAHDCTLQESIPWVKLSNRRADSRGAKRKIFGSYPLPGYIYTTDRHEYILVFRKLGKPSWDSAKRKASTLTLEEWHKVCDSVWTFPGETHNPHCAPFPRELPWRLIKMYTILDDLVFDPFMGSGTTAVAADCSGRNFFGCDTNPNYVRMALRRVEKDRLMRSQLEMEFV